MCKVLLYKCRCVYGNKTKELCRKKKKTNKELCREKSNVGVLMEIKPKNSTGKKQQTITNQLATI